ncbi:Breast cancer metastasis-suppressor 1-like protein, partial [Caligus rogercresseyi]
MEESGLSGNESGVVDSSDGDAEEDDDEEDEDSSDSSDMDVQECEKKRFEFIDDLSDLEKQFAILREQLYRERMTQIENKLMEVKSGKAAEYLQPLEELQINMKNRMEVGAILRDLRLENINCKFDAEKLATHQNFL